jgi:geranylgeranyl pyrophosphate synthase
VGIAFQIADDLLDAAGGLSRDGGDRALQKATYPVLLGVERAHAEAVRLAEEANETLREAGIESAVLERLAFHVVERER